MKPLIDADILLHEIGWSGEFKDKETDEEILMPWDHVQEILDGKIVEICEGAGATEAPLLFISDSEWLSKKLKRKFVPNFRYEVAKTKPYKGTRKNPKPFHFYNIIAYLMAEYEVIISDRGFEADDMMGMYQTEYVNTIICSRDKDLRIIPGWHYSWECGGQREIEPTETDELGWLILDEKVVGQNKNGTPKKEYKLWGYGLSFFYAQMLMGDSADNIPGCPKIGPVKAFDMLSGMGTHKKLFKAVRRAYIDAVGKENAKELFLEQANLLWMAQTGAERYSLPEFVTNK